MPIAEILIAAQFAFDLVAVAAFALLLRVRGNVRTHDEPEDAHQQAAASLPAQSIPPPPPMHHAAILPPLRPTGKPTPKAAKRLRVDWFNGYARALEKNVRPANSRETRF